MDVVIAGGHGQIGLRLARLLSARGERVRSLIRNPDHAADVSAAGAEPVVADLEALDDLSSFVSGADAVVFAAGAGPGSGPERKRTVDYGAAVKLIEAARAAGVRRYLEAKADADAALVDSGLDHTIVRPGRLTDDPGTSRVAVGERLEIADIPRDDVAAVLVAALDERRTVGKTFVVVQGDAPIPQALSQL